MKQGQSPKNAKATKPKLSPQAWRMIRAEAKSLGMTQDEYVRLTGTLFSTLRRALGQKHSVDGKGLLHLVENPLFGIVIQYMASNMSQAEENPPQETQVATSANRGTPRAISAPNSPMPLQRDIPLHSADPPMLSEPPNPAPLDPNSTYWQYW